MAKALVTGASGFIGHALASRLLRDGWRVRVLARDPSRLKGLERAEVIDGDLADPAALERAVAGAELVFNVAATFREPDVPDRRYWEVNADAVGRLIEAARRQGVRRVVHTSTVGIHGRIDGAPATEDSPIRPDGIYEVTKAAGDALALAEAGKAEGPEIVVLRPAPVYGPGDTRLIKLFKLAAQPRPVLLGDGRALYQMVHIADLIEAFLIADEERPTVGELMAAVARAQGRPEPRPLHLPAAPVRLLAHGCELVCRPLGLKPPVYRRRVDFFLLNRQYDIGKARRLLGYAPAVPLENGLRQTIDWCRREGLLAPGPAPRAVAVPAEQRHG